MPSETKIQSVAAQNADPFAPSAVQLAESTLIQALDTTSPDLRAAFEELNALDPAGIQTPLSITARPAHIETRTFEQLQTYVAFRQLTIGNSNETTFIAKLNDLYPKLSAADQQNALIEISLIISKDYLPKVKRLGSYQQEYKEIRQRIDVLTDFLGEKLSQLPLEFRFDFLDVFLPAELTGSLRDDDNFILARTAIGTLTLPQMRSLRSSHPELHKKLKSFLGEGQYTVRNGNAVQQGSENLAHALFGSALINEFRIDGDPHMILMLAYVKGEPLPEDPEVRRALTFFASLGSIAEIHEIWRTLKDDRDWKGRTKAISPHDLKWKARLLWALQFFNGQPTPYRNEYNGAMINALDALTPEEVRQLALWEGNPLVEALKIRNIQPVEAQLDRYMKGEDAGVGSPLRIVQDHLAVLGPISLIEALFQAVSNILKKDDGSYRFASDPSKPPTFEEHLANLSQETSRRLLRVLAYLDDQPLSGAHREACRVILNGFSLAEMTEPREDGETVAHTLIRLKARGFDLAASLSDHTGDHFLGRIKELVVNHLQGAPPPTDPLQREALTSILALGRWDELTILIERLEKIENPPLETRRYSSEYDEFDGYDTTEPSSHDYVADTLAQVEKHPQPWRIVFLKLLSQTGAPFFTNDKFFTLFMKTINLIDQTELTGQATTPGSPFAQIIAYFGQGLPFLRELWERSVASGNSELEIRALAALVEGYRGGKRLPNQPSKDDLLAYALSEIGGQNGLNIDPELVQSRKKELREFVDQWNQFITYHFTLDVPLAVPRLSFGQRKNFMSWKNPFETLRQIMEEEELGWNVRLLQSIRILTGRQTDLTPYQFETAKYIISRLTPKQLAMVKCEPGSPLQTMVLFRNAGVPLTLARWNEVNASNNAPRYLEELQERIDFYRRGGHLPKSPSDADLLLAYESLNPPSSFTFEAFTKLLPLEWKDPPAPFISEPFQAWIPAEKSAHQEMDKSRLPEILTFISAYDDGTLIKAWDQMIVEEEKNMKPVNPILDEIFPQGTNGMDVIEFLDKWKIFLKRLGEPQNAKLLKNTVVRKLLVHAAMALAWRRNAGVELRQDILALFPLLDRDEQVSRARRDISSQTLVRGIRALSEFYNDAVKDVFRDADIERATPRQIKNHRDWIKTMMEQIKVLEGEKVLVEFIPSSTKTDIAIAEIGDDCSRNSWKQAIYRKDIQIIRIVSEKRLVGALYVQETILDGEKTVVVGIQPRKEWNINKQVLLAVIEGNLAKIASLPKYDYDAIALRADGQQQTNRPDMLRAIKDRNYDSWPTELKIEGGIFQGNSFLKMWKKGSPLLDIAQYDQPPEKPLALEILDAFPVGIAAFDIPALHPVVVMESTRRPEELGGRLALRLRDAGVTMAFHERPSPALMAEMTEAMREAGIRISLHGPGMARPEFANPELARTTTLMQTGALVKAGDMVPPGTLVLIKKSIEEIMLNERIFRVIEGNLKVTLEGKTTVIENEAGIGELPATGHEIAPQDLFDFYNAAFEQAPQFVLNLHLFRSRGANIQEMEPVVFQLHDLLEVIPKAILSRNFERALGLLTQVEEKMTEFESLQVEVAATVGLGIDPRNGMLYELHQGPDRPPVQRRTPGVAAPLTVAGRIEPRQRNGGGTQALLKGTAVMRGSTQAEYDQIRGAAGIYVKEDAYKLVAKDAPASNSHAKQSPFGVILGSRPKGSPNLLSKAPLRSVRIR